jgi:hypothetical protein
VTLFVYISNSTGYQSKGSAIQYTDYPEIVASPSRLWKSGSYHDRYLRGVKFTFTYGGSVGGFDFDLFIAQLISVVVLTAMSELIVASVAYSLLGYRSKVYKNSANEKVSVDRLNAKIAVQTALSTATWHAIRNLGAEDNPDKMSKKTLVTAYEACGLPTLDSDKLAEHCLLHCHADGERHVGEGMTFLEFADLVGSDEVTLQDVLKFLPEPIGGASVSLVDENRASQSGPPMLSRDGSRGMSFMGNSMNAIGGMMTGRSQPQTTTYEIIVPPHHIEGGVVAFRSTRGATLMVQVPPGARPGMKLRVEAAL